MSLLPLVGQSPYKGHGSAKGYSSLTQCYSGLFFVSSIHFQKRLYCYRMFLKSDCGYSLVVCFMWLWDLLQHRSRAKRAWPKGQIFVLLGFLWFNCFLELSVGELCFFLCLCLLFFCILFSEQTDQIRPIKKTPLLLLFNHLYFTCLSITHLSLKKP